MTAPREFIDRLRVNDPVVFDLLVSLFEEPITMPEALDALDRARLLLSTKHIERETLREDLN